MKANDLSQSIDPLVEEDYEALNYAIAENRSITHLGFWTDKHCPFCMSRNIILSSKAKVL